MSDSDQAIRDILQELEIVHDWYEHESMHRCEDTHAWHSESKLPGVRAKNLFLRNKNGKRHFMLILPQEKSFDTPLFREMTTQKCGFASEERMMKYLGVKPGSVSPFCLITDDEAHVEVLIDASLMEEPYLYFHPQRNTASIQILPADLEKWFNHRGNPWQTIDWPDEV